MDHMTALVSTFARAYHYQNNEEWVFADVYAERMLKEEEYEGIAHHMADEISCFASGFEGTKEEALRLIVNVSCMQLPFEFEGKKDIRFDGPITKRS